MKRMLDAQSRDVHWTWMPGGIDVGLDWVRIKHDESRTKDTRAYVSMC